MQTVGVKHGEVVRQTCSEPCRCGETASSRRERHHLIPAVCAVGVHMKQQHRLLQCDIVARLLDRVRQPREQGAKGPTLSASDASETPTGACSHGCGCGGIRWQGSEQLIVFHWTLERELGAARRGARRSHAVPTWRLVRLISEVHLATLRASLGEFGRSSPLAAQGGLRDDSEESASAEILANQTRPPKRPTLLRFYLLPITLRHLHHSRLLGSNHSQCTSPGKGHTPPRVASPGCSSQPRAPLHPESSAPPLPPPHTRLELRHR